MYSSIFISFHENSKPVATDSVSINKCKYTTENWRLEEGLLACYLLLENFTALVSSKLRSLPKVLEIIERVKATGQVQHTYPANCLKGIYLVRVRKHEYLVTFLSDWPS
jgi:hypothetical protein